MGDASSPVMAERTEPTTVERVATLAAWGSAVALFLTVGWFAMAPDDPLGSVSVYARNDVWMMYVQAMALSAVAAAVATVLAGRRVVDIGTFAAAIGLGVVALRGATAEYLLVRVADLSDGSARGLALRFAVEAVGWFLVVSAAVFVSALVVRWCFGPGGPGRHDALEQADDGGPPLYAGLDAMRPPLWRSPLSVPLTPRVAGVQHMLITAAVALAASAVLSAGLKSRSIQHGQVCFVVAAAFSVGVYAAQRISPVRSALWAILAVGLVAVLGYIWASLRPEAPGLPPNIPASHFLRVLPIQFISVGTAAVLATFWSVQVPSRDGYAPGPRASGSVRTGGGG